MSSVIVVGAGHGGLSTAIHDRLAGHDVIVVGKGRIGGKAGSIEQQGYLLDPDPSIFILKALYEEVFRRAGRYPEQYLTFRLLDLITRVFFRSEILDIPSSVDEACRLVRAISPRDADSLQTLIVNMKPLEGIVKETIFKHPYETPQQCWILNC
jgi:phytoene desaturase